MGVEASFQAIPEDCELLARARRDLGVAELMQFFHNWAVEEYKGRRFDNDPNWLFVFTAAQGLIRKYPGLGQRYYCAWGRKFDAILYLLSPERRAHKTRHSYDGSLIDKAITGCEPLHPMAKAVQGQTIRFVPASDVRLIADYLDGITFEQLCEHYDPDKMEEALVYKIIQIRTREDALRLIWEEFTGMRDLYRAAADHNEAVITVID